MTLTVCGILGWSCFNFHLKGDASQVVLHHFSTAKEIVNKELQKTWKCFEYHRWILN